MGHLYANAISANNSVNKFCAADNDDASVWHSRLGHDNFGLMSWLSKMSFIINFTIVKGSKCHIYVQKSQP